MSTRKVRPVVGAAASGFGWRRNPISGQMEHHNGTDFAVPDRTPIYAVCDGVIVEGKERRPGSVSGFGNWIWQDSQREHKVDVIYGHMRHKDILVQAGNRVTAGQLIGYVGSEGTSTGPHLHLEFWSPPGRVGGGAINPEPWLADAEDPAAPNSEEQNVNPSPVARDVIDYSAGVPAASAVKAAGFAGAVRYVSPPRDGWMRGKPLTRRETDDYRAQGLDLASNWQYGKRDFDRGFDGGVADARQADRIHREAGGPAEAPIYFSIDQNPAEDNSWDRVRAYLDGAQSVVGKARMGVYGNRETIQRCAVDWGIGTYFWQHGWDGINKPWEQKIHPAAHLYQYEIDKANVAGIGIDRNRVLKSAWGQWSNFADTAAPAPVPAEPVANVLSPEGYPIVEWRIGQPNGVGYTEGHGVYERAYIHTSENQDWKTTAENVAEYQARVRDGSYHALIDDEKILLTVPLRHTAWGVLRDNPTSIQICLVGTSGEITQWTGANPNQESRPKRREQWLEHAKQLDMLAYFLAWVNKETGIPLVRVDIDGVGRDEQGVSTHHNYTYGSVKLWGRKDGTHWDVPDTFPHDKVLGAANEYAKLLGGTPALPPPPPDPDAYPLVWTDRIKQAWGPLEGPSWSISNRYGNETQASRDGLKRWQATVGIPATGVYDAATRDAAMKLQQEKGWPPDPTLGHGLIWLGEWNAVIKEGWRLPTVDKPKDEPAIIPDRIAPIDPGPKADRTRKIKDLTGPGHTTKFHMEATDLGVCTRTPSGRILAIFGDTFRFAAVGSEDWRSPVGLFSDTKNLDEGLVWHEAAGGDSGYAKQLWDYQHDNGEFSTVLPSDVITIGDTIYLHAMVNKGLHNVVWTELHKSTDDGRTWSHGLGRIPANWRNGLAQLWTMCQGPDGWIYVMSTSFRRSDPVILQRVRPEHIEDHTKYEGWGFKPGTGWAWGNEPTPVLEKVSSAEKFGEMSLRYIQGQYVLVTFDVSSNGGYDIDVRVFENITDNLYYAKKTTPIKGATWGMEGDDKVAQLYGPSIIPGSRLDGGFHIVVSQWNTGAANGWPYRSMQFKIPVDPVVPPLASGDYVPPVIDAEPEPEPLPEPPVIQPDPETGEITWPEPVAPQPVPSTPLPTRHTSVGEDIIAFFTELFRKLFRR